MTSFQRILLMLALLSLVLSGARLDRYVSACYAQCATAACRAQCDAAAGR